MITTIRKVTVTRLHIFDAVKSTKKSEDLAYVCWFRLDKNNSEDMEKLKEIKKLCADNFKLKIGRKLNPAKDLVPFSDGAKYYEANLPDAEDFPDEHASFVRANEGGQDYWLVRCKFPAQWDSKPVFKIKTSKGSFRQLTEKDAKFAYAGASFDITVSAYSHDNNSTGTGLNIHGGVFVGHGERLDSHYVFDESDFEDAPIFEDADDELETDVFEEDF